MSARLPVMTPEVRPAPNHLTAANSALPHRIMARLIGRSGDLKRALLGFAGQPVFARALEQARLQYFGGRGQASEGEITNFLDCFILQHRLPNGDTLVDRFVAARPHLPDAERKMLLGWRGVVEGLFEVLDRDGDALLLTSLLDELTYRTFSNQGAGIFQAWPRGSFLHARLVPLGADWLFSGCVGSYQPSQRDAVHELAAKTAMRHPEAVFRNPQKVEQAKDLQREWRLTFIRYFGSDLLVLPGEALAGRMHAFIRFCIYENRDANGTSAADRVKEEYGITAPVPRFNLPEDLLIAKTVGVMYDEVDGLIFLADFALVEEAFARPDLAASGGYRDAVLGYLKHDSIPPSVFRRLAARDQEKATQLFRRLLRRPRFHWGRDGEALLRTYKARYFERPRRPSVIPVGRDLALAQIRAPR